MVAEKHPYCRGEYQDSPQGIIYVCGYRSVVPCEQCRYNGEKPMLFERRKNPEAKGNRPMGGKAEQLTLFPRKEYGTE